MTQTSELQPAATLESISITLRLPEIAAAIGAGFGKDRAAIASEKRMHELISSVLRGLRVPFAWEFRLSNNSRLDFFVDSAVAIEVKKGNAGMAEFRQVARYLEDDRVRACIIVAMRVAPDLPVVLKGKKVFQLELWRYLL